MRAKVGRLIVMVLFHSIRMILKPLDSVAPRQYMWAYQKLLGLLGVRFVGPPRYISTGAKFDEFHLVELGERVVISDRVILLTHDYSLTTGLIAVHCAPSHDVAVHRKIRVGRNVFIGMGTILMPGAFIGDDVVIGAGSVVRGVIPDDSVVIGNPAVVIGRLSDKASRWRDRS